MLMTFLVVLVTFLISEFVGYVVHRMAHWPKSGLLYKTHLIHHFQHYPPGRYLTERYLGDLKTSFIWWFIPAFLVMGVLAWCLMPWYLFVPALVTMIIVSLANTILHDSFHVDGHWLKRFGWHRKLGSIHYIHHMNVKRNLGIYFYAFDRITGNFKNSVSAEQRASGPSSHSSS